MDRSHNSSMDGGPRTAIRGTRGTFETRAGLGMAKEQSPIDPEDPAAHGDELPGSREPPRTLQKGEDKLWAIFCDIDEDRGGTLSKTEARSVQLFRVWHQACVSLRLQHNFWKHCSFLLYRWQK